MRFNSSCFRPARAALLIALLTLPLAVSAAGILQMQRITLTVADLKRTEAFYRDGLGFHRVADIRLDDAAYAHLLDVPHAKIHALRMQLGHEEIEFDQYAKPGKSYPRDSESTDLWFQHCAIIVSDMGKAYAQLKHVHFVPISEGGPQTLPPDNGQVQAFKFRDPDGHPLELLYFPEGQGRSIWHQPVQAPDKVFLGIDHSAIGSGNTARSETFYEKLLGLKQAYQGVNIGEAQQRLDGTFNATVLITGIRPEHSDGAGVELLDYRAPSTGKPMPPDVRSNDIVHAHLTFQVNDIDTLAKTLFDAGVPFVSPSVVSLPPSSLGAAGEKAIMVRDPDGHDIELVQ